MFSNRDDVLRLQPSNLNDLIAAFAKEHTQTEWKDKCHIISTDNTLFILANVSKDSSDKSDTFYLQYISDVLSRLKNELCAEGGLLNDLEYAGKKITLLLPIAQCLRYLIGIQKAHFILLQVDIQRDPEQWSMQIHDSRGRLTYMFYPDIFKDKQFVEVMGLKYSPDKDYHSYGTQSDDIYCGYYVHQYIRAITEGRDCKDILISSSDQGKIVVNYTDHVSAYQDKVSYLKKQGVDIIPISASDHDHTDDFSI